MKNLLEKLKAEPVMAAAVVLAVFLAALITANVISMEDVNRFVALVVVLVPIVLGLLTRQFTAPATGDAGAVRENAVVARTLGRVASGEITAETMGAPLLTIEEVHRVIGNRGEDENINARGRLDQLLAERGF